MADHVVPECSSRSARNPDYLRRNPHAGIDPGLLTKTAPKQTDRNAFAVGKDAAPDTKDGPLAGVTPGYKELARLRRG